MIGIWPVKSIFPDMNALAAGVARWPRWLGLYTRSTQSGGRVMQNYDMCDV